ncbi:hypothetical protein [Herbaspirillum autotrophicum]|uniref:hypothetical protein n=1 Tax=Herbaspirillum autotrophicum TaxID=180195 RepID=UPI00067C0077|nr:hypothetical protein [Herbaspirillum autotrophicum]
MFIKFWNAARWFLLAGSIFIAGMVCAMFVKHPFKDIGDLATWAGAVGTFLAFCGTIWLAFTETRNKQREERTRAVIASAGVALKVSRIRIYLQKLLDELHPLTERVAKLEELVSIGGVLQSATLWTQEDATKLVSLPNDCAAHLAFGLAQYHLLIDMLIRADENTLLQSPENRKRFCVDTISVINYLLVSINLAEKECRIALEEITSVHEEAESS